MSWMPITDSFEVAGAATAPLLALSALEWQVIGLAIREASRIGGGRIFAASRWRRLASLLTGSEALRPLADPRLETLRSFVCAVRNGHKLAERLATKLLDQGYSSDQVSAVRLLAAR
ncbi:hypothetical protein SAMN06295912_105152 [Sphingomonas laterariae]|uniref:Uncharacterized protein n=1 Tax=Edaphosphingomonas laterariae TaxID=861865 RepID=A0A239E0R1_9SPHN|nr:hypothetical protein [Sphingomonas laterariae]SNS38305.1 hypothetical protein SAMN06295912_105152 [Sphingomonas laterariae]